MEIIYEDAKYPSAEHAFQAAKCIYDDDRDKIRKAKSPSIAKKIGRSIKIVDNWENKKRTVMFEILEIKFRNSDLRQSLIQTGIQEIVEHNNWHDVYWGVCDCQRHKSRGKNMLGILLEEIRANIFLEIRHLEPNIVGEIYNNHSRNSNSNYVATSMEYRPRNYRKVLACTKCDDVIFSDGQVEKIAKHILSHTSGPHSLIFNKDERSYLKYACKRMFRCENCTWKYDSENEVVQHCCVGDLCIVCDYNPCCCCLIEQDEQLCYCYSGDDEFKCSDCREKENVHYSSNEE